MSWTTVQNTPADPGGMTKPQRCSICRAIVPMAETMRHDRETHREATSPAAMRRALDANR